MKKFYMTLLISSLLLVAGTLIAGEETGKNPSENAAWPERQAMLEEAEKARLEAETARLEAAKAAEMAGNWRKNRRSKRKKPP